jgi:hypothetical protein
VLSRSESSQGRGVSPSHVVSDRRSFARPALPGVNARMSGSDFRAPLPASSLLHLFTGARFPQTNARISLVTTCSQCQARRGLGPRGAVLPLTMTRQAVLPAGGPNPSALSNVIFGALRLQGRHHPLPLHLACFRAYAWTHLLPGAPQGSIPGSRLTTTRAGLSPARTRGLARPHWPL